jgi:hypothetical protein
MDRGSRAEILLLITALACLIAPPLLSYDGAGSRVLWLCGFGLALLFMIAFIPVRTIGPYNLGFPTESSCRNSSWDKEINIFLFLNASSLALGCLLAVFFYDGARVAQR